MAQQLIFTSAPSGLRPGSRGFTTVAASPDLSPPVTARLEGLSAYAFAFDLADERARLNPVVYSHLRVAVGGRNLTVLSRVAPAGADYSGRSNTIAHHLIIGTVEHTAAGPAKVLTHAGLMVEQWSEPPRHLEPAKLPANDVPSPTPCKHWGRYAGDPGWGGYLAGAFLAKPRRPVYVVYRPGADVLSLIVESMGLLPPARRWSVTFSTYFTGPTADVDCLWRFVLDGTPAVRDISPDATVIDLRRALGSPEPTAATRAAQTGTILALAPTIETAANNVASKASKPVTVEDTKLTAIIGTGDFNLNLNVYDEPPELAVPVLGGPTLRSTPSRRSRAIYATVACLIILAATAVITVAWNTWLETRSQGNSGIIEAGRPQSGDSTTKKLVGNATSKLNLPPPSHNAQPDSSKLRNTDNDNNEPLPHDATRDSYSSHGNGDRRNNSADQAHSTQAQQDLQPVELRQEEVSIDPANQPITIKGIDKDVILEGAPQSLVVVTRYKALDEHNDKVQGVSAANPEVNAKDGTIKYQWSSINGQVNAKTPHFTFKVDKTTNIVTVSFNAESNDRAMLGNLSMLRVCLVGASASGARYILYPKSDVSTKDVQIDLEGLGQSTSSHLEEKESASAHLEEFESKVENFGVAGKSKSGVKLFEMSKSNKARTWAAIPQSESPIARIHNRSHIQDEPSGWVIEFDRLSDAAGTLKRLRRGSKSDTGSKLDSIDELKKKAENQCRGLLKQNLEAVEKTIVDTDAEINKLTDSIKSESDAKQKKDHQFTLNDKQVKQNELKNKVKFVVDWMKRKDDIKNAEIGLQRERELAQKWITENNTLVFCDAFNITLLQYRLNIVSSKGGQ